MRRILVHIPVEKDCEYDVFSSYNNDSFVNVIKEKYAGICPNVGNRLWFQGIVSAIQNDENQVDYWNSSMSKDFINNNFDLIVAPMANVFAVQFIALQETIAERFRGIKIPVYVIACGIQASSYDELDEICRQLKKPASKFISSVYDTGGEFALRGYFTKEFFDRLGYPSAVVTGCPSLYQLGRNLQITNRKVEKSEFNPVLNGLPQNYKKIMSEYPNAVFLDQDVFWDEILNPACFGNELSAADWIKKMVHKYGYDVTKYLLEGRINLIPDMNQWREFIRRNHFSCSFGSRIHGNIMPLLAGIPSILECRDARTREMAEFFEIPHIFPNENSKSLYDLYVDTDYTVFNEMFVKRFNFYEEFLRNCGITSKVNVYNSFFREEKESPDLAVNLEKKSELLEQLREKDGLWKGYSYLLDTKRKVWKIIKSASSSQSIK